MNILDIIITVVVIGGVLFGYQRGFINQLISLAGLIIAYILAYQFFDDLAPVLRKTFPVSSLQTSGKIEFFVKILNLEHFFYNAIAFALIFFCVKIGLTVAGHLLNIIVKIPGLNLMNKFMGALLAFAEIVILVALVINVMNAMPSPKTHKLLDGSKAAAFVMEHLPVVTGNFLKLWNTDTTSLKAGD